MDHFKEVLRIMLFQAQMKMALMYWQGISVKLLIIKLNSVRLGLDYKIAVHLWWKILLLKIKSLEFNVILLKICNVFH